jgi:hypothetical protein
MATAVLSSEEKDACLTQFLSMMEDRVDPDVAKNLLEAVNWDVQAATEQLYGGMPTPAQTRPGTAMSAERDMLASMQAEELGRADPGGFAPTGGHDAFGAGGFGHPTEGFGHAAAGIGGHGHEDAEDPAMRAQLDAAIAASYAAQTGAGMTQNEDEMLAQAMRMSQQEEDNRQRQQLRQQQEAELAESELMDQMRERAEQERRQEDAALEQSRQEEERRNAAELEAKRARVPSEPAAGEPGRVALMFRLPGGQRIQRAFRSSEVVGSLYDFLDVEHGQEFEQRQYRLVSTMPRKEFTDRGQKLEEAGIQNQFVLMAEVAAD